MLLDIYIWLQVLKFTFNYKLKQIPFKSNPLVLIAPNTYASQKFYLSFEYLQLKSKTTSIPGRKIAILVKVSILKANKADIFKLHRKVSCTSCCIWYKLGGILKRMASLQKMFKGWYKVLFLTVLAANKECLIKLTKEASKYFPIYW